MLGEISVFIANNATNSCMRYIELPSKFSHSFAFASQTSNFFHFIKRQTRRLWINTCFHTVGTIIFGRTQRQMSRIYANFIMARMANHHTTRYAAFKALIGKYMSALSFIFNAKTPVAASASKTTSPVPAYVAVSNFISRYFFINLVYAKFPFSHTVLYTNFRSKVNG
jgi:hypothetical protein